MSVFTEEWRECLREQYKHVIHINDKNTIVSLTGVMLSAGFREDELAQLRVEATIRTEDMPDDFIPDLEILQDQPAAKVEEQSPQDFQPHPLECQCPSCMEISMTPHDEEGQPLEIDEEEQAALAAEHKDNDEPKQMSMF